MRDLYREGIPVRIDRLTLRIRPFPLLFRRHADGANRAMSAWRQVQRAKRWQENLGENSQNRAEDIAYRKILSTAGGTDACPVARWPGRAERAGTMCSPGACWSGLFSVVQITELRWETRRLPEVLQRVMESGQAVIEHEEGVRHGQESEGLHPFQGLGSGRPFYILFGKFAMGTHWRTSSFTSFLCHGVRSETRGRIDNVLAGRERGHRAGTTRAQSCCTAAARSRWDVVSR
jgi:hypothetical protein